MAATMEENPHDARNRQFYSLPEESVASELAEDSTESKESLLTYIRNNVIGKDKTFSGPFGLRKGWESLTHWTSCYLWLYCLMMLLSNNSGYV